MRAIRARWIFGGALAIGALACNAIFGDTTQCATDDDCAGLGGNLMCGGEGTCVTRESGPGPVPNGADASTKDAAGGGDAKPTSDGTVAKIIVSPPTATIATGAQQMFYAVAQDSLGAAPTVPPMYTWSVSSGGTISPGGLFKAGNTAGGPFTVTVASGAISATATVTVSNAPPMDIKIGETNILNNDDMGNMDILLAQEATLADAATIKSLSFYVVTAAGKLRLGVYDDNNGMPGNLKAMTAEVDAAAGWMAVPVVTQVLLPAGKYWLAYAPSDNALTFKLSDANDGKLAYFNQTYGEMPAQFSATPTTDTKHWSFYATLTK